MIYSIRKVQYKDENLEEYDSNNDTVEDKMPIFEPDIDISFIIPEEDLMGRIIDNRFVIGNLLTIGHVGMIREGK